MTHELTLDRLDFQASTSQRISENGSGRRIIADVRNDFRIVVARLRAEFLPFRIGAKSLPQLFARRQIFERKHVNQIRHFGADDGLSEEHRLHTKPFEDADLGVVEHLYFSGKRRAVVGFVHAQFEYTRRALRGWYGSIHLRHSLKTADQRTLHTLITQ